MSILTLEGVAEMAGVAELDEGGVAIGGVEVVDEEVEAVDGPATGRDATEAFPLIWVFVTDPTDLTPSDFTGAAAAGEGAETSSIEPNVTAGPTRSRVIESDKKKLVRRDRKSVV